jgi:hypothetical protein
MPDEHTYIGMRKVEPDRFIAITLASDYSRLTRISEPMTEVDVWAYLHKQGMPNDEIRLQMEEARKNPV